MITYDNADQWSDRDIAHRVCAVIRETVGVEDELKAARLSRKSLPTAEDVAFINWVDSSIEQAIAKGAELTALRDTYLLEKQDDNSGQGASAPQEQDVLDSIVADRVIGSGGELPTTDEPLAT